MNIGSNYYYPDMIGAIALIWIMGIMMVILIVPISDSTISAGGRFDKNVVGIADAEFHISDSRSDRIDQGSFTDTDGTIYIVDEQAAWWLETYYRTHPFNYGQRFRISTFSNPIKGDISIMHINLENAEDYDDSISYIEYIRRLP